MSCTVCSQPWNAACTRHEEAAEEEEEEEEEEVEEEEEEFPGLHAEGT